MLNGRSRESGIPNAIWGTIQSLDEHDIILISATAVFAIVCVNAIPPPYSIRNMLKLSISAVGVSTTSYFAIQRGLANLLLAYIACVSPLLAMILLLTMWKKKDFPKTMPLRPRLESEKS